MRRRSVLFAGALLLAGCELPSFGAPDPASAQGSDVESMWKLFFLAGLVVAAFVWGLIAFVTIRCRRRDDTIPNQRSGNIRLEILYTATPIVVVAVLFGLSVATEQRLTRTADHPAFVVNVTGFQWGWRFEYPSEHVTVLGTGESTPPELVLPVDETVQLVLSTNDVIHSFFVPHFLEKRDLIQGVDNKIDVTPTKVGRFDGRCAEFCGLDHWRMNFVVDVMSRADFDQWLAAHR